MNEPIRARCKLVQQPLTAGKQFHQVQKVNEKEPIMKDIGELVVDKLNCFSSFQFQNKIYCFLTRNLEECYYKLIQWLWAENANARVEAMEIKHKKGKHWSNTTQIS